MEDISIKVFPLYHGTDIRIVNMSKEERQSFKIDCINVVEFMWNLYKNDYYDILNGKYKTLLGELRWLNLCNALTICSASYNGNEQYRYDSFHLSAKKYKAENYARRSFAFGEIGLLAYRMYDSARFLDLSIIDDDKNILRAANKIVNFAEDDNNIHPVVFEIYNLDLHLLSVEKFGNIYDVIKIFGDRFHNNDFVLHYSGEIELLPAKAIYL